MCYWSQFVTSRQVPRCIYSLVVSEPTNLPNQFPPMHQQHHLALLSFPCLWLPCPCWVSLRYRHRQRCCTRRCWRRHYVLGLYTDMFESHAILPWSAVCIQSVVLRELGSDGAALCKAGGIELFSLRENNSSKENFMCVPDVLYEDLNRRDGVTIWCSVSPPPIWPYCRRYPPRGISVSKLGGTDILNLSYHLSEFPFDPS